MFFYSFLPHFGNNAPTSDSSRFDTLQKNRSKCAEIVASLGRIGVLAAPLTAFIGCHPPAELKPPRQMVTTSYDCSDGYLSTNLHGAINTQIQWSATDLECAGMPRPDGAGARLRFAGRSGDERRIAIIISMPGLDRGAADNEYASTVTLIEEGSARFFNSADLNNCWTEITSLQALDDSDSHYSIGGALYCVLPLAEVNGNSSVSISELDFQGLLDWNAS